MCPISVRDEMGSTKSISALLIESSSAHSFTRSTLNRDFDPHCRHSDGLLASRCSQSRQRTPSKCTFRVTTTFSTRPASAACNTSSIPTAAKPLFSCALLITSQRDCSDARSCSTKRSKSSFSTQSSLLPKSRALSSTAFRLIWLGKAARIARSVSLVPPSEPV